MAGKVEVLPVETPEKLPPEVQALVQLKPDALIQRARELTDIALKDDADEAGRFLRITRMIERSIAAKYKRMRDKINEAVKQNRVEERNEVKPWADASAIVAPAIDRWLAEERRKTDEANRKRLEEATEKARVDQQQQAATVRAAAEVAPTMRERQALERQARQIEQAPVLPVVSGTVEAPKIDGIATPTTKVASVTNLKQFLRAVVDGKIPEQAVTVNQSFLDDQARKLGAMLNYPGVVVVEKTTLSARGL